MDSKISYDFKRIREGINSFLVYLDFINDLWLFMKKKEILIFKFIFNIYKYVN